MIHSIHNMDWSSLFADNLRQSSSKFKSHSTKQRRVNCIGGSSLAVSSRSDNVVYLSTARHGKDSARQSRHFSSVPGEANVMAIPETWLPGAKLSPPEITSRQV